MVVRSTYLYKAVCYNGENIDEVVEALKLSYPIEYRDRVEVDQKDLYESSPGTCIHLLATLGKGDDVEIDEEEYIDLFLTNQNLVSIERAVEVEARRNRKSLYVNLGDYIVIELDNDKGCEYQLISSKVFSESYEPI